MTQREVIQGRAELVLELDASVPLLHVTVAFATGTLADPEGKEGTTRLLLRLLRRSAGGRGADECDELLDSMGAALSGEASRSVCAVHGTTIARSTAQFLAFLKDALSAPHFDEAEFSRAVRETRAELVDALDNDSQLVRSFWARRFYRGHPYARPSIGTLASLARITLADVEAQYRALLSAGPLTVAMSGAGDESAIRSWLQELLAALPGLRPASAAPKPDDPEGIAGRVLRFVDKPERSQTQILIGCQGTHPRDEDHTALYVGNTILGGTFTARLSQEVRAKRGWSYGAYSNLPIDRARQPLTMWTFPRAEDAAACIELELEILQNLIDRGVSKRELASAKKYLTRSHAFNVDTPAKRAGLAVDIIGYDLPPGYYDEYPERVRAVTLDEVNGALSRRLSADNLLVCVVGTHDQIGDSVTAAIERLADRDLVRFDDEG